METFSNILAVILIVDLGAATIWFIPFCYALYDFHDDLLNKLYKPLIWIMSVGTIAGLIVFFLILREEFVCNLIV